MSNPAFPIILIPTLTAFTPHLTSRVPNSMSPRSPSLSSLSFLPSLARSLAARPHSGAILSLLMRDHLLFLGVPPENIHIQTHLPAIDWEAIHRIERLAAMRNDAMRPFYDSLPSGLTPDGHPWTAVVFYNDVYLSATHFLEMLHQHFAQDADMTCGWDHAGKWFYDGWVGRDMSGDLYTPFPVKEEDRDLPQKVS